MNLIVDRVSLKCAEEVFKNLGMAASCIQTYAESHPRYTEAIVRVVRLIEDYFQKNPESKCMTYIVNGQRAEFRKIPLMNAGSHGANLVKLLTARGLGGLQVQRGISAEQVGQLIAGLLASPTRPKSDSASMTSKQPASGSSTGPSDAGCESAGSQAPGKSFELISTAAVGMMQMDWEALPIDESGDLDGSLQIPEFQVFEDTARSLLTTYRTLLSRPEDALILNHESLKDAVDQVMTLVPAGQDRFGTRVSTDYFDDFTFHHSVNVCLITTAVIGMVSRDKELERRISLAALLHDVGKSKIPEEILHKPGKLTTAEFQCMQKHPVIGAEILLGIEKIDPLCVAVAFGHHLPHGTTPYPKTIKTYNYEWVTRLISVVDVYEALTAVRPYKKGLSSETAFQVMLSMPGLEKNIDLVKLLYDCVGPYPPGAVVELSTGERAVVIGQNPTNRHLPKMRVFTDAKRNLLPDTFDLDLGDPQARGSSAEPLKIVRTIVRQSAGGKAWQEAEDFEPTEILGAPLHDDQTLMSREG
jgi:HD-GYP domain-containing protein (c-di-GMP phosphodiesterase class II)